MANKKDRISQLANRLQSSEKKEDNVSASSSSSSSIKTSGQTRYDRIGQLADVLTRWGYETKAPSPKTEDELFIGSSERASQMPTYEVPEQKPRFVLPSNTPRTTKNSPTTTTSNTIWGSSNFGAGAKMPTFDSKKLTAGDVAESVGNSAFQGVFGELANSLYGVAAGAENVFEKYLLGYDDPEELSGIFQSLRDLQSQDYDARQQQITQTSEKSPVMEVVNNLVPDTARNVRDLLLSMATGGAWAGVKASSAAENLSRQILTASQGIGAQATQYISDVMRNPQFYSVLAETIGGSYTDALSKGATEEQALISSALSAIPNALIEVGGGTEDVVRAIGSKQFKSGLQGAIDIGKSALEEAGEEILQDAVTGIVEKGTWDYDRPTFTGEFDSENDAVYNLARMLESAGYAIAGTVLTAGAGSAIQRGTSRILTDADRVSAGSEIKKADGGNQLLKIAATSESQEVQNQRSEIMSKLRKGQNVSAYSLGKLAESISNDATINLVESTKRVQTADNTQNVIRDNAPISNQSAEGISAIDAEIRRYTTPFVQNAPQEREMSTNVGTDLIEDYASRLGESGAKAFRQIAENSDSNTFQRMRNAFQAYYNYGNWGKKIEDVSTAFSDSISSGQAYQAFTAGQNDAASSLQADTAAAVPASAKGGLVSSRAASMVDKNTRLYLDGIGRELGVQIEIESGERDAQGNLLSNGRMVDGKIYISASSKKPIASVLNHELTHILQERSPEQYREYKNFVASYLDSQNSGWFESQVQRMIDGYESIGESISREMAEDEVVSDAAERFLSDETAIKELIKENRSVAQKVLDAIRDIIRKLANIVRGDNDAESTASRILREQEETFRQAEKMWAKALAESAPMPAAKTKRKGKMNAPFSQKKNSAEFEENYLSELPGAEITNDGAQVRYNLQTFSDTERQAYIRDLKDRGIITQAEADELSSDLDVIVQMIEANRELLDYDADIVVNDNGEIVEDNRVFNPVKQNSDPQYKVSVDFSTLCRKRVLTQQVVETLQAKLKRALSKEEQLEIRNELVRLRKEGAQIDVACGLCYVESRRLLSGSQIQRFLDNPEKVFRDFAGKKNPGVRKLVNQAAALEMDRYNEENGTEFHFLSALERAGRGDVADRIRQNKREMLQKYAAGGDEQLKQVVEIGTEMVKSHPERFLSANGLTQIRKEYPAIYDAFTSFIRNATKSKAQETRVPWVRGDSLSVGKSLLDAMNKENGIRSQSWSDYEVIHTLDYIAAVMELSARGAKLQTYTKVPDFVRLMGETNAMINLSMISESKSGIDGRGHLVYDEKEGMPLKDMLQLRKRYPKTAGSILVGISDEHILAALKSDDIDYVIPYHASGMSKAMQARAGVLGWQSYENTQNEHYIGDLKKPPKAPVFSEWGVPRAGDDLSDGIGLMRKMADRYLELCRDRDYIPKFPQFLSKDESGLYHVIPGESDNYWKLLIDRKMISTETGKIDGEYIVQQPLVPKFNLDEVRGILQRALGDKTLQENAKAAKIVVDRFLKGEIYIGEDTVQAVRDMDAFMTDQAVQEAAKDLRRTGGRRQLSEYVISNGQSKYMGNQSYRGTKGRALSDYGHAMFSDNVDDALYYMGYEGTLYSVNHSDLTDINQIKPIIAQQWDEDVDNENIPYSLTSYEERNGEWIAEQFDPVNINDNAQAWDDGDLISWAFDKGIFDDISGVKTRDGAVAWDEDIIHKIDSDPESGVIGYNQENAAVRRQLSEYVIGDEDEYEFAHAQPDENYQLEGREDDPGTYRSREQDIEAIGLDTGWLDRHISGAISMDESGTLEDRIDTLKKESEVLKNVKISDEQLEKIAGRVLKEYDSNLDEKEFTAAVKSAVEHIGRRGAKGYEQAFVSIYDEMVKALEQSESLDKSLWDAPDVKEIRKSIRETRLYVSDDQKRDFQNFAEYKRDHREFKLVNDPTAMPVDQFYSELSSMYPGYFDAEKMTARDELDEISEWLGAVKPTVVNWYEGNIEQVAADATADIIFQVNHVKARMPEGRLTKQLVAQQERFEKRYQQLKERYLKNLQKADERLTLEKERRALDRAKAIEKIQQLKAHNREVKKRASDRRAISQSRKKIERIVDKLSRKLLKPTDTQNVPVELRGAVSRFLQAIDFRSYRAGEVSDTQKTQRWQDLQNILARISREEDSDGFDGMYFTVDPDMERRMRELMQSGVPVNLSNISREQIEELEKLIRAVDHMVRFVGKIRVEGQMMEATETARQIIDENSGKIKGTTRTTPIALRAKQFFQYDLLDPTRFSDMFGKGFYKIIHNLRMAENDKIRYWSQTESAFEQMLKDNGFTKKSVQKMGEDYRDVIIGGKIGKMSTAQIMSLYLANKREQGRSHLYGGGIALPDSTGRVITRHQKTYQLTEEDVSTITGMLSDSQRRLADAMQRFLSDDVAAWGNRMSRYLYGYDKFTEKNYWPISSDPNYTRSEVSLQQSEAKSATIKNLGMTKALVEKASNPIVIDSAFQVFAKHATQMAAYGAYVGPLEDLNKVMNWQTRHDGNWRSVRETISAAGGREAIRYLYKLIDDVNGQSRSEGDPYSGLMGAAKAASVAGNLRVVVQQPTAFWRAMAVIPPQYLVKGIAGKRVNVEEMLNTAPVAQWKSWGYFRDGVSGSNLLELMQGKTGVRERFVDWSMSLAGKADDMTWRQIYRAVESWVSGTTDLERGSEAFRQEVGKRFTEVVDRTQVVDSVFQRTQAMRNTGFGWKLATSFMAEPLKSYNLLVGSARNFVNAGKGEKGEAARKMLMAALGFTVSSVINAVVQSAWDVGRDKDPDEKIVEKFMQAMFGDTANDVKKEGGSWYDFAMAAVDGNLAGNFNPMSMIPVLNDIWSILEGFDPEVMGLSAISDILSSGQTLYKSVSEGSGKYTAGYNAVQFVRKLSAATGLPIGNIYRELESLVNFTVTAAGDWLGMDVERLKFEINKLYLNPDQNRNIYYQSILDARTAGDDSLAAEIANYLLSKGIKRSSIETGLANLIATDESNADLIAEYAQAYQNRDMEEMSRLEAEGKKVGLSGLDLQNAAERYLKNLEPDSEAEIEAEEEFSEQDFDAAAEYDTGYTIDVLADAIVDGDRNTEQQMRSQLKSSGKTDEDIDKSIKSELKSRMAENAGFESVTQMEDAGEEFDTTTKEYQILHDKYRFTQYGYSDLYEALVDGRGYEAIYDDMLGQTSSGDNTYSAEGIEKEMKSRLQEDFNARYKGGTGTGWEFYMKKLKEYGKTWDEILTSWKRSKAGQEWNDSH